MKPEGAALMRLQEPATGTYPELYVSSPKSYALYLYDPLDSVITSKARSSRWL